MSNQVLFNRAIRAYKSYCKNNRFIYQQPKFEESKPIKNGYLLKNFNGFLAKYSDNKGTIIHDQENV